MAGTPVAVWSIISQWLTDSTVHLIENSTIEVSEADTDSATNEVDVSAALSS